MSGDGFLYMILSYIKKSDSEEDKFFAVTFFL